MRPTPLVGAKVANYATKPVGGTNVVCVRAPRGWSTDRNALQLGRHSDARDTPWTISLKCAATE